MCDHERKIKLARSYPYKFGSALTVLIDGDFY